MTTHKTIRPAFSDLIDPNAPVRPIGQNFDFTEGPIWHPVEQHLSFSDMPGDVRRRWDGTSVQEIARPSNKGNGMTYDRDLNLLVCEHSTSCVARFAPDGTRTVLASHFGGKELNSPNDLIYAPDGSIYFTDPWYGRMPGFGIERPRDLGWQGVFRIPPNHRPGDEPELLVDRYLFTQPNGLCLSPDGSTLYVNDTEQANIRAFALKPDGSLGRARMFATGIRSSTREGVPDGMKCDAHGNIWVTAPGGVWVFDSKGRHLGEVSIPEKAANLAWGGADWRTLFVCASTSVYAIDVKTGPSPEPYMQSAGQGAQPAPAAATAHASAALDPSRCALIIQDMQNDVVMDGGAFADSGAPEHAKEQRSVENAARLAAACRRVGIPVIHVHFIVRPGAPGMTLNAPLFEGVVDETALVENTWGSAAVDALTPEPQDHVIRKFRMSAFEGTSLETILRAEGRDTIIECGAWTNMSIEHTARTGADKGYVMIIPEDACSTMNADWHRASIDYAMQNVAAVTTTDDLLQALGR